MTEEKLNKPRRGRLKRAIIWCGGLFAVCVICLTIALFSLVGTRVAAPDWVKDRITQKISSDVQGLAINFGEVAFVMQQGWVPRLSLRNVVIQDDVGTPLAQLTGVQGSVALAPLLRGQIQPGSISLDGAQMLLRRDQDGSFGVSLGGGSGSVQKAQSLAALIEEADAFFETAHFSALKTVSVDNLILRYEDARAGQAWTVDGGRISLVREGNDLSVLSDFVLLGNRDYATTLSMGYDSRIGSTEASLSISFEDMPAQDIAGQSPALSWLNALEAPISGALTANVDNDGALGPLQARLEIGAGALHPNEASRPIAFEHASTEFTYDPVSHAIRFTDLTLDSKWGSARVAGQTHLLGMEDGWPHSLVSQFQVSSLTANPLELYEQPISFEGAALDMRLRLDPFEVTIAELSLKDQGQVMRVHGDVSAEPEGWRLSVDAVVPEISPERLMELWPESLEPKTRTWITSNVKSADLNNIQVAMRGEPAEKPKVYLGFDFDALETRFVKNVPHIEGGRGHASIYDHRFVIAAQAGYVTAAQGGRIDIAGSSFDIPDIRIKRGPAVVRLKTESTITAALSLLDAGPFRFLQKAGRPVTMADGRASLDGRLDFLVKDNLRPADVAFEVTGILQDVRSETLIENRVLASSSLNVDANSERLRLSGAGRVGQVPFEGTFNMPLTPGSNGRSEVTGWIELSERFTDEFKIGLPPDSVSGAGRGDLEIAFARDVPAQFSLTSDLAGLGLRLRPLDWSLSEQATGSLEVSGSLGEPPEIDRIRLNAGGLQADGKITLKPDGQLQQASFSRVQMGTWIDAPVDLVGLEPGRAPLVRVLGGSVDLRQTSLAGNSSATASPQERGPLSVRLDRLQISDGIALTDFTAELNMSRGAQGEFTGKVNGQAVVTGEVVPQRGRSAFTIRSADAGSVFRSAGLLKQARDGELELFLSPTEERGTYSGKVVADGMRVKDAPAIAALLNAVSVVGLLEQLGGEGIHFSRVQAKFQLAPDRVTIYSGSAVGASMGISTEGYYYLETEWLDMEGVVSPVYAVNGLGSLVTRRGEGLVGFTYSVDGPKRQPRVKVNPLSVLTPGLFREVFRRAPPKLPGEEDVSEDTTTTTREPSAGQER